MPQFAVIVPAFNASATLAETLDSIESQIFTDWECIVVNDGSTDETHDIAESYSQRDSRFRVIDQQNAGTAMAYAAGITASRAGLLSICASDDMLLPAHLQVMSDLVKRNPSCSLFSSNGEYLFHASGHRRPVYDDMEWSVERSIRFSEAIEMCFFSVGAVFRRSIWDEAGGHRKGVYVDDYDFWLRAMAHGARLRYTPEVLAVHRVSDFQQTSNYARVVESNVEVFENLMATAPLDDRHRHLIGKRLQLERDVLAHASTGHITSGFPIPECPPAPRFAWVRQWLKRNVKSERTMRVVLRTRRFVRLARGLVASRTA